jgi:hypothetical protein
MNNIEIKRNLYRRGSSFETTIPMPLLFALDKDKKYHIIFRYNEANNRWYIDFEEMKNDDKEGNSSEK